MSDDPRIERDGACPAVTVGGPVPHRWVPLAISPETNWEHVAGTGFTADIGVVEVCPACRGWHWVRYSHCAPQSDGVQ